MVCRFALLALFVLSALSCSGDSSSQESSTEYGKWDLKGYVSDPIEEKKVYFIMTYSNFYGGMELIVHCGGFVWIQPTVKKRAEERLLLNYRSSSESHLAYALRAKWGSGTAKHIDKIWAQCERNSDCQNYLNLFPYRESSFDERLIEFEKNKDAKVVPSLKEPMTTYDQLMLEVQVIQHGSKSLGHYTFDLDGFAEAHDALLAKEGCKPIPPLTAVEDLALHTLGAVASKRGR